MEIRCRNSNQDDVPQRKELTFGASSSLSCWFHAGGHCYTFGGGGPEEVEGEEEEMMIHQYLYTLFIIMNI